nr:hypothetical protein CFP56_75354 [Quercus suber]
MTDWPWEEDDRCSAKAELSLYCIKPAGQLTCRTKITHTLGKILSADKLTSFDTEIITLSVGDAADPSKFYAHRSVLTQSSKFFQAALGQDWVENQNKCVTLPEDNFDSVKLYLNFMYTGHIPYKRGVNHTDAENYSAACVAELESLAYLYVFGEKYQDSKLKDAVIDAMVDMSQRGNGSGDGWHATGNAIDIIYRGTMQGSPMRRLLIQQHLQIGHRSWLQPNTTNNADFLLDISATLLVRWGEQ